jgi:hypothetical protein
VATGSSGRKNLRDVQTAYTSSLPAKRSVNVHQTGIVESGADFGLGIEHALCFVREHSRGDLRILDGEGAAETAALVRFGQGQQTQTANMFE